MTGTESEKCKIFRLCIDETVLSVKKENASRPNSYQWSSGVVGRAERVGFDQRIHEIVRIPLRKESLSFFLFFLFARTPCLRYDKICVNLLITMSFVVTVDWF